MGVEPPITSAQYWTMGASSSLISARRGPKSTELKGAVVAIDKIVTELKREGDRISRAIASLEETDSPKAASRNKIPPPPGTGGTRGALVDPTAEKRISKAIKKRWQSKKI
jgi:hypothetical protein